MGLIRYILVNGVPLEEKDFLKWAYWWEDATNRVVFDDEVDPDIRVSTIFLGLDYSLGSAPEPILYETMIFNGEHDGDGWRWETLDQARAGHLEAVELARRSVAHGKRQV